MISKEEIISFLQATEFFQALPHEDLEKLYEQFETLHLHSGETLIKQGDLGDCLYVVVSGRLRATTPSKKAKAIGEMGRGDLIGELALLTQERRAASVIAIRDSVLLKLTKNSFDLFVQEKPLHVLPIFRSAIVRILEGHKRVRRTIATIAVVPAGDNASFSEFTQLLVKGMEENASLLHLNQKKIQEIFPQLEENKQHHKLINWLNHQESEFQYIVYEGDAEFSSWTERCIRQADHVLLIANDNDAKFLNDIELNLFSKEPMTRKNIDLVILHDSNLKFPTNTKEWLQPRKVNQYHHVRKKVSNDLQRVIRYLSGQSIGLVFGGGGARGFAHIGIYKALRESGIEVDFFGGSSFGAMLACFFAMEKTPEEAAELLRPHAMKKKKFLRFTAPFVAINSGKYLMELMKLGYSDPMYIEDLWKHFFCVVCNLSKGEMEVHDSGVTWRAIRATISLPAIFPPISNEKNELLVDGGVSNNLPVDVMRRFVNGGKVISSHVQTNSVLEAHIPDGVISFKNIFIENFLTKKSHFPNIAELIVRSIGLSSLSQEKSMMNHADYNFDIDARVYGLLDFGAMDKFIELGYRYAMEKLATEENFLGSPTFQHISRS